MTEASVLERILRHPIAALLSGRLGRPAVHAVGGIVRDAVLSTVTDDLDLSVAEDGAALARQLADESGGTFIALGGDRFSSYRVVAGTSRAAGAVQADIWDREGGTLRADLERRDLTINSIACPFDGARLQDPFGGLSDLGTRTLRATKLDCFERDPLRVLRLARFRLSLDGFGIEGATAAAARVAVRGLERVATERVRDELQRILSAASTRLAFDSLHELGALAFLVPGAANQRVTAMLLDRAARLDGCLAMLRAEASEAVASARMSETIDTTEVPWQAAEQRLAAISLFIDLPNGDDSPAADGDVYDVRDLEKGGLATRKTLQMATRLLADQLPHDEDSRRLFLLRHGPRWPLAVAVTSAARSALDLSATALIARALERTANATPSLVKGSAPLLNGHAAARLLGVEPGPVVGETLRALQRAQALGQVNTHNEAEDFVRKRRSVTDSDAKAEHSARADATSRTSSDAG